MEGMKCGLKMRNKRFRVEFQRASSTGVYFPLVSTTHENLKFRANV